RLYRAGRPAYRAAAGGGGSPLPAARIHADRRGGDVARLGRQQDAGARRAAAGRHRDLHGRRAGVPGADPAPAGAGVMDRYDDGLTIAGLSTGYSGREVIAGLDLPPIAPGQVVSLLGPNAAG